ncbi:unnamed protein product [Ceratitis capitata]|uniref:(Mediterranean fruit fly) hypothetical protein n=1 Tax=Ceratitis capitata TaxID=7213 RepID=A0A811UH18_CERCA|nr:unnamed protein product [Ceratitis capitata]
MDAPPWHVMGALIATSKRLHRNIKIVLLEEAALPSIASCALFWHREPLNECEIEILLFLTSVVALAFRVRVRVRIRLFQYSFNAMRLSLGQSSQTFDFKRTQLCVGNGDCATHSVVGVAKIVLPITEKLQEEKCDQKENLKKTDLNNPLGVNIVN